MIGGSLYILGWAFLSLSGMAKCGLHCVDQLRPGVVELLHAFLFEDLDDIIQVDPGSGQTSVNSRRLADVVTGQGGLDRVLDRESIPDSSFT